MKNEISYDNGQSRRDRRDAGQGSFTFREMGERAGSLGLTRDELKHWVGGHLQHHGLRRHMDLTAEKKRADERLAMLDRLIERKQNRVKALEHNIATQRVTRFEVGCSSILVAALLLAETVFSYATLAYGINLDGITGWIMASGLTAVIVSLEVFIGPVLIRPFLAHENRTRRAGIVFGMMFAVILAASIMLFVYMGLFRTEVLEWTGGESFSGYASANPDQAATLLIVLSLFYLLGGAVMVAWFRELVSLRARHRQLDLAEDDWMKLCEEKTDLQGRREIIQAEQECRSGMDQSYSERVFAEAEDGWFAARQQDANNGIHGTQRLVDHFFAGHISRMALLKDDDGRGRSLIGS